MNTSTSFALCWRASCPSLRASSFSTATSKGVGFRLTGALALVSSVDDSGAALTSGAATGGGASGICAAGSDDEESEGGSGSDIDIGCTRDGAGIGADC